MWRKLNILFLWITTWLLCYTIPSVSFMESVPQHNRMRHSFSRCQMNFFENAQTFLKSFSRRAEVSHILLKGGGAETEFKLHDLKETIGNSPIQFAAAANQYSECPSAKQGGNLGSFGPGTMVKEFDQVVFQEAVGQVHGPIRTQFGYHLIYIHERND